MSLNGFANSRFAGTVHWTAFALLVAAQFSAVVLDGGVWTAQWVWIGSILSLAALLAAAARERQRQAPKAVPELVLLWVLLLWFVLQWLPLPPAVVGLLSPDRLHAAQAARQAVGADLHAKLALSVAPAATLTRLLFVLPAMAMFLMAREAAQWWNGRKIWLTAVPLIAVALFESVLGMIQSAMAPQVAHGTYVDRDHFAGLLEMTLPLAVAWAASLWIPGTGDGRNKGWGRTLGTILLAATASCFLVAVIRSLSRMGFFGGLLALVMVGTGFLGILRNQTRYGHARSRFPLWLLPIPALAVLALAAFTTTSELLLRFADVAQDARLTTVQTTPATTVNTNADPTAGPTAHTASALPSEPAALPSTETAAFVETSGDRPDMWRATFNLFRDYRLTGVGLGAFQDAFYRYQTFLPGYGVDFAHNDYLQILAELGLIGASLVMALIAMIIWRLAKALRRPHPEHWPLALGVLGGLAAIALHSLVDFNLYIPANALVIAWLAGLAVSPTLQHPGRLPGKPSRNNPRKIVIPLMLPAPEKV